MHHTMINNILEIMKNYFGNNLRYLRLSNNMTQTDLAIKLNISRQAVSNYERGHRFCNLDILIDISNLFDISIDNLLKKKLY